MRLLPGPTLGEQNNPLCLNSHITQDKAGGLLLINKRQRAPQRFEAAPFWCALGNRAGRWTMLSLCWASCQKRDQLHTQNDITPAPARPRVCKLWQVSGETKSAFQMKLTCSGFPRMGTVEVNPTHNTAHARHT